MACLPLRSPRPLRAPRARRGGRGRSLLILIACLLLPVAGLRGQPPAAAKGPAAEPAEPSMAMATGMQQVLTAAIARAGASVVAIARVPRDQGFDAGSALRFNLPGFERPLLDPQDPDFVPLAFAAGVIISADGDILTCFHALGDPEANDYYVWRDGQGRLASVQSSPDAAEVAAGDPWTDLAVLKIEAEGLPVMPFGDANALRRGYFVVALGNPYAIARDGQASASLGIVANLQRAATAPEGLSEPPGSPPIETSIHRYGTLIQTDAKLNLGSSGGALVNLQGEMVGLTTSLAAVAGYEQAAGYAIPIDPAMRAAIDALRAGKQPSFGFLGIEPLDAPGGGGAVVNRVVPGMPADEAGLIPGDVIQAVEATPIRTARDLIREMSRRPANRATQLVVGRALPGAEGKGPETLTVRLGKKRLATPRPAYQSVPDPRWRGMQVDFATALPPQSLLGSRPASRTDVAVMTVTPDSPAWQAGVRAGQMIASVDGQPISDPAAFYRAVAEQTGTVPLQIQSASGRPQRLLIGPDAPADSDAPAEPPPPAPP